MAGKHLVRSCRTWALAVIVLTVPGSVARAQPEGTRTPVPHQQVVSANPFGLMFEWFNGEYERKVSPRGTIGVSASGLGLGGDAHYFNTAGFYRFYPQGAALSGFFIGGRAGVHRVSSDGNADVFCGLGFELGYTWLFGANRNVAVSLGAGATRIFGGDLEGVSLTIPTLRLLNVGIAF